MDNLFNFQKVDLNNINIDEFNSAPNKSIVTTVEWIRFIEEDSKALPYILRITRAGKFVGYFSSLIIKKFGFKIVGSPFPGWSTVYMGLDVLDISDKIKVLPELISFVMKDTGCAYFQITDRDFNYEELEKIKSNKKIIVTDCHTLELDLAEDDAAQYKKMKTDCRNFIKQFERRGAVIEQAEPNDAFAVEYYELLKDVFAKQNLVPTYTAEKVKCLIKHLAKSNSVLCLRVKDPEGNSIATSIFPGFNKKMFFWGGASLRPFQHFRPNEYMIYTAMHYWRERGCTEFDMVGDRQYKKKFGSWPVKYPTVVVPKYAILVPLKQMAAKLYYFSGKLLWKLHVNR